MDHVMTVRLRLKGFPGFPCKCFAPETCTPSLNGFKRLMPNGKRSLGTESAGPSLELESIMLSVSSTPYSLWTIALQPSSMSSDDCPAMAVEEFGWAGSKAVVGT